MLHIGSTRLKRAEKNFLSSYWAKLHDTKQQNIWSLYIYISPKYDCASEFVFYINEPFSQGSI